MYIKRIAIMNFKVYPGENVIDFKEPNPTSGLNCYLFGGLNGHGKTSLLQAIVLGLYGQAAEGILFDRSKGENLQKVYSNFVEEGFSHVARAEGAREQTIEVVLQDGLVETSIGRTWYFADNGSYEEEDLSIFIDGKPLRVTVSERQDRWEVLQEYVDSLIPSRVAKFFFFDGEEIKSIAERDPSEAVIEGLDALLGFSTLARLDEDLDKILREIQSEVDDSPTKASYLRAQAECDELRDRKERLEEELNEVERKANDFDGEMARVDDRLTNIFHGTTVQESSEVLDRISQLDGESRSLTNEVGRFVGDLLYVAMPSPLLAETAGQVDGEVAGRDWLSNKTHFDPQRDKVLDRMFSASAPQPTPPLTKPQRDFLQRRLQEEWTEMFNPPPTGVPERELFGDWPKSVLEDAVRHLSEVRAKTRQELVTRIVRRNQIERDLQRLRQAQKQFQVGPEAQEAINRKTELAAQVTDLRNQELTLNRELTALAAEIGNANAKVSKLAETLTQTESVRKRYEAARDMRNTVRDFMDELRQRRIASLSRKISEMMKRLAHKEDLVSKVTIDPDTYLLRILNSKGEEVHAPSAGEREVFGLSMLWGLAQISGRSLPVVIDTPLGRLDQSHRATIVKSYFPRAGEQVIILSTDAEIDETWYRALKPAIVQEFSLEHDDETEVTTVVADRYFEFS